MYLFNELKFSIEKELFVESSFDILLEFEIPGVITSFDLGLKINLFLSFFILNGVSNPKDNIGKNL